ncbi:hypothetical protein Cgig2_010270 [Carnegiea gigantea]|uniref:Uncharacterized protein n=1 Tax=Carnegiea gigantea TaxID=171969 RepID=A0A9Q1JLI8_9CARY|nr:hypothetical protein Cgig2_010270 [Carnegiea gigantea]
MTSSSINKRGAWLLSAVVGQMRKKGERSEKGEDLGGQEGCKWWHMVWLLGDGLHRNQYVAAPGGFQRMGVCGWALKEEEEEEHGKQITCTVFRSFEQYAYRTRFERYCYNKADDSWGSAIDEQKRDITELGFAFLLTLKVDKIPSRLARWLVQNFDTCRRAVKLASNEELRSSEEDVYLTMGFPRGTKPVQEAKKSDKGEYTRVLDEWKAQWAGALPKTHQVLSQMKNQRQGGDMFKRNFIVYVVTTLVKGQQTLCINDFFRSANVLLYLCYVDRVMCKKGMISKEFLILANWTSKDLWAQINFELESCQGFGKGIEDDRIKAPDTPSLYIQEEEADIKAKKACVQKISRSMKNFPRSVIEVVDAVSEAQQVFPASTQMDKVQAGNIQGHGWSIQTQPGDANAGHQATPSSQDDGLFASDPSFWDACVELAKTYEKTSGIACPGTFTPPGFDLGFDFRLSQSVQVESPNQGGSGVAGGIGSGGHSSPNPQIDRSPHSSLESLLGDSVGDWLPPKKKMPTPHFRSPFFVRHIDVMKSLTIREKQVSNWAFLPLEEVHYNSELLFTDANFNITRSVIRTLGCGDELDHAFVLCESLRMLNPTLRP